MDEIDQLLAGGQAEAEAQRAKAAAATTNGTGTGNEVRAGSDGDRMGRCFVPKDAQC